METITTATGKKAWINLDMVSSIRYFEPPDYVGPDSGWAVNGLNFSIRVCLSEAERIAELCSKL